MHSIGMVAKYFYFIKKRHVFFLRFLIGMYEAAERTKRFRKSGSGRLRAFRRKANIESIGFTSDISSL